MPGLNPIRRPLQKTQRWLSSFSKHIWDSDFPVCQQTASWGLKVRRGGFWVGNVALQSRLTAQFEYYVCHICPVNRFLPVVRFHFLWVGVTRCSLCSAESPLCLCVDVCVWWWAGGLVWI